MHKYQKIRLFFWLIVGYLFFLSGCGPASIHSHSGNKKEHFDLYLLIGQSNMAGRAPIKQAEKDTLSNVYLFTGDAWVAAANPLNKYSTVRKVLSMQKLGPGYSFARKLSGCTGRKIGLIVNARGGTAIEWWEKDYTGPHDYNLYEEAVKQAQKAQKYGQLKGILWLQGEADTSRADNYMFLLKEFVKDLRHDLGNDIYFLAGEIGEWQKGNMAINRVIRSIPNEIKNAGYVSSDGLAPLSGKNSSPHFNTRSQIILGKRYADKVLEKVYNLKPCDK